MKEVQRFGINPSIPSATNTSCLCFIGAIVAAVITAVITWVGYVVWLDEWNCIWWWISQEFLLWLYYNYWYLVFINYYLGSAVALDYAMYVFLSSGYLRVGSATFYDGIGAGSP